MNYTRPGLARLIADEHRTRPDSVVKTVIDAQPNTAIAALKSVNEILSDASLPNEELAKSLVVAAARALEAAPLDAVLMSGVRDGLLLGQHLLRLRGAQLIDANLVVAQRLRTERALGAILPDLISEGRAKLSDDTTVIRLADLSLSRDDSMKFQRMAQIEADDFEEMIRERINSQELSTAWAVRLWHDLVKERPEVTSSQVVVHEQTATETRSVKTTMTVITPVAARPLSIQVEPSSAACTCHCHSLLACGCETR